MDSKANENSEIKNHKPDKPMYKKTPLITKLILIFETLLFVFSLFFLFIGLRVFLGVFSIGSFLFFLTLTLISLFSKNLRSTFWLPITFVFCIMAFLVFIIAVSIPLDLPVVEVPVVEEEVEEEPVEVEEPVEEEPVEAEPLPDWLNLEEIIRNFIRVIIETINEWLNQLGLEIPLPDQE